MYLCTIEIDVRAPGPVVAVEVDALASSLHRNGQLVGPFVVGRSDGGYRITGMAPQVDSLEAEFHSDYVDKIIERLEDDFGADIGIELKVHDEPPVHASSLDVASELYLLTYPHWHGSSILADTGLYIPLYLLPVSADVREHIVFWSAQRQYLQRIEYHSGALEREAAGAITSPVGLHAEEGRKLCRTLEEATGIATHYGLYCPADLVADLEVCPQCKGELEVRVAPNGDRLRICGACRLAASD